MRRLPVRAVEEAFLKVLMAGARSREILVGIYSLLEEVGALAVEELGHGDLVGSHDVS
jgi:hypothetical protein